MRRAGSLRANNKNNRQVLLGRRRRSRPIIDSFFSPLRGCACGLFSFFHFPHAGDILNILLAENRNLRGARLDKAAAPNHLARASRTSPHTLADFMRSAFPPPIEAFLFACRLMMRLSREGQASFFMFLRDNQTARRSRYFNRNVQSGIPVGGAEVIFANCLAKASPFPRDKSSGQIFLRRSFLPRRFPPIVQLSRQFLPRAHSAFRPPMIVFSLAPQ